jgi:hypothetical protein
MLQKYLADLRARPGQNRLQCQHIVLSFLIFSVLKAIQILQVYEVSIVLLTSSRRERITSISVIYPKLWSYTREARQHALAGS